MNPAIVRAAIVEAARRNAARVKAEITQKARKEKANARVRVPV